MLLWIVAIWAIIGGIFGIPAAASLASGGARVFGIILAVLSIIFGIVLVVLLFVTPSSALIGLIYVLGAYAVLSGIVLIVIAFQARGAANANLKAA